MTNIKAYIAAALPDHEVHLEYPGHIEIETPDGALFVAGTANGPWDVDFYNHATLRENGEQPDTTYSIDEKLTSDEEIATAIIDIVNDPPPVNRFNR